VIDLHLHTTASDGRSTPEQLVQRAARAGLHTIAVTDHDTTAALAPASAAAAPLGIRVVPGIEVTAVHDGTDVHLLGYFFDPAHPELVEFMAAQRADRHRRVLEIIDRLRDLGVVVEAGQILKSAAKITGKALGRPIVAQLLVSTGHARDMADAFDRYLAAGRPAFVPRRGAAPVEVIRLIDRAGGVVSFAHPGKLGLDHLLAPLAAAGLAAVETFHPDHDDVAVEKYEAMAEALSLARSGGSDYHGPGSGRAEALGQVTMPQEAFDALAGRAPGARRPA
jgi:predicted metal-dependent phosphoesterase TrpH